MAQQMKLTLSVIKADVGSVAGHNRPHPDLLKQAEECLAEAKGKGMLIDYRVTKCGDDIDLIMTHQRSAPTTPTSTSWPGTPSMRCTEVAKETEAVRGGPGPAGRRLLRQRQGAWARASPRWRSRSAAAEPVIIFMADKTAPGAWNMPLYKMFADPFNTIGLVIDPEHARRLPLRGARPARRDQDHASTPPRRSTTCWSSSAPPALRASSSICRKDSDEIGAGHFHPEALPDGRALRRQGRPGDASSAARAACPRSGEVAGAVRLPLHLSRAGCAARHHGPFMPVAIRRRHPHPLRRPAAGRGAWASSWRTGKLVGPRDMFADMSFDNARQQANWTRRTTCGATAPSSRTACRWTRWSTPPCPRS